MRVFESCTIIATTMYVINSIRSLLYIKYQKEQDVIRHRLDINRFDNERVLAEAASKSVKLRSES